MRLVPDIIRRATAFYRKRGFRALVRAIMDRLSNAYQAKRYRYSLSLKAKPLGQGTRILYIDFFSARTSNLYWLKAFQKFGTTRIFDIRGSEESLGKRVANFQPTHVHLGTHRAIRPKFLADIKRELNCTVSAFYGDAKYSPYHCQLAEVADYIYISNKTHIRVNEQKGYHNFRYMPCPTAPEIFGYEECIKVHDLVFIGNNKPTKLQRVPFLKDLANSFDLRVLGNGWEGTGLNYGRSVYGKRFSRACNQAKICLSIVEPRHTELEAYFSNRLVNTLATRSFCIQTYTPGLEHVFINRKHLVWYTSHEELYQLIEHYLDNEGERERIAAEGQKEVYQKYTYDRSVERILGDVGALPQHWGEVGQDWKIILNEETERRGERFTIDWYRNHIITKELLKSGILQGEIIDLGCGIGTRAFLAQEQSGARITGIDASQYAINHAINNFHSHNLDFLCGDLTKMPFKDGAFDNAYMLAVIEHIVDTSALLGEIKRIVKSKGRLFLSVTENNYHSDSSHVHIFTKKKLKKDLGDFKLLTLYVKGHIIFATIEF